MTRSKWFVLALIMVSGLVSQSAAAEPRSRADRWVWLGEVGTHRHDANDYVPIATKQRFDQIELRARGQAVRIERVLVQYLDGRDYTIDMRGMLMPGARVVLDVPAYSPIRMVVLNYNNRGPYWRAREEARVAVRGLQSRRYERPRMDRRDDAYGRDRGDRPLDARFQWRGGIYVRVP